MNSSQEQLPDGSYRSLGSIITSQSSGVAHGFWDKLLTTATAALNRPINGNVWVLLGQQGAAIYVNGGTRDEVVFKYEQDSPGDFFRISGPGDDMTFCAA